MVTPRLSPIVVGPLRCRTMPLYYSSITSYHYKVGCDIKVFDRPLIRNYQGTTQITSVDQLGRNFVANVVRFAKWAYYLILHNVLGPWWSLVFPARYSSFLASDQRHCRGFRVPPGTVQLTHVVWWYHSHPTKIFPDGSFNEDDTFLVRTFYCPFEREGSTCSVCS